MSTWPRDLAGALTRGVFVFAATGGVLLGLIGTAAWPIVGTAFGAVAGVVIGSALGAVEGVCLTLIVRVSSRRSTVRAASAAVAVFALVALLSAYDRLDASWAGFGRLAVLAVGSALAGPSVLGDRLDGPGRTSHSNGPRNPADSPVGRVCRRMLLWGATVGAVAGGGIGLAIGVSTYVPTAPFALLEGGLLGGLSGLVLAGAAAGVLVLARY